MTQPNVLHAWKCLDQVQSQLHCTLEGSVRQLQSPEKFRDASKRLHEVLRDITPLEVEMFDSLERNLLENDDGKGSYMSRIWHALLMLEDELDVIAALGLIEGMCLLRYESKYHFRAKENFQTLLRFLDNPSPPVKLATLHCLEALLVDSAELTRVFERADGVKCVSALVLQPRGGDPQFHYVR
ncbi:hypothetical protein BC830DRAFT_830066 [Chytriomyces sp. MP71]|nr:hypothetical protein BC830DRAFT_830066 [Chytriomyces sp. MP71]